MDKIILHLDFNSYFASVEQQANPFLRGKAIAIGGKKRSSDLERTVITTASREAKAVGIKTAMASTEAKRLSRNLKIIPGDPRKYSEITNRFLRILQTHADAVEQFSTDEAFADLTVAAGDYFGATMFAQMIREEIKEQCGAFCTVSIGIGPNKLIAKLASEIQKPNGLTVIPPHHVRQFINSRPLNAFCGIGPRIEKRLNKMGVTSVRALQALSIEQLRAEFKSYGDWLYAAARGIGDDQVESEQSPPKSIGHSYTFSHDLVKTGELQTNLLALCDKVTARMRRDGFVARKIGIHLRFANMNGKGMQRQLDAPIFDGFELYQSLWPLLQKLNSQQQAIRLIGVRVSDLVKTHIPERLFPKENNMHRALEALDTLQSRYGKGVWMRAATMKTEFLERTSGWHYDHEL